MHWWNTIDRSWWQLIVVCAVIFTAADKIEKAIREALKR